MLGLERWKILLREKAKENTPGWEAQRARSCKAGKQRKGMSEMSEVSHLANCQSSKQLDLLI